MTADEGGWVLADGENDEAGFVAAQLDANRLAEVRRNLPALTHRQAHLR